jgi:uncharacterized protein (UPF0276 family)
MDTTAGLGFKPEYLDEVLAHPAAGMWYEVHAENYMLEGGPRMAMLAAVRREFPVSVHGVGLSLASDERPDKAHLQRLRQLVSSAEPFLVSEHLSWSAWDGRSFPDLLPFPRSRAALPAIARNIEITQERLGRRILIENPSQYLRLAGHELTEPEFLSELVRRTGCGLLLDVYNVYVSAHNLGFDAHAYLAAFPVAAIEEIHLAGHSVDGPESDSLLIDTHGAPVCAEVWGLYEDLIARIGPRPTLIERDDNLPPFAELAAECERARAVLAPPGVLHRSATVRRSASIV